MDESRATPGKYITDTADAADVYPLRLLVLRPEGTLDDCRFAGDEDIDTRHITVADSNLNILAIVSCYRKFHPELPCKKPVQLRGMASHPAVRGKGCGARAMEYALELGIKDGNDLMWCNAREAAVSFYARFGFSVHGGPFEIAGIGPHRVMWKRLVH